MKNNKSYQSQLLLKQKIALILFGLFLFLMLLEASLRLGGAILLSIQEHRNLQSMKQKGAYRILCLGESTTGGQYPPFLEEMLNQRNIGIKFSVIDDGTAGFNTKTILQKLEGNLDKYKPQMVIAMMGINDGGERAFWENKYSVKVISFLESFRVYKLARLIWLHMQDKFRKTQGYLLKAGLSIAYAGSIPAEDSFKKTAEPDSQDNSKANLKDDQAYLEDAELYSIAGRFADAEASLKKALAINPQNNFVHGRLIFLYWDYKYFPQSVSAFEEAIKINPLNAEAYYQMSGAYTDRGEYSSAEQLLRKTIEISPDHFPAVSALTLVYRRQGKYLEIEKLLKKYIKQYPQSEYICSLLAAFYEQTGRYRSAKEYYKAANKLRMQYYNPTTRSNYLKLKSVLDKRNIKLVCMQYPVRSVEPLKEIFPDRDGIIFVDNEKVFKDALKSSSYESIFRDSFAGDFGHCTDKGNQLLAQHIADVILKNVFGK
ncbi:MAG: tetratricopeptide repeat protein [Candidatus Omnitrophica bacterium]|nr:tetratricopeptide repeat protein [Candidatus Omnitrophota bacterium]